VSHISVVEVGFQERNWKPLAEKVGEDLRESEKLGVAGEEGAAERNDAANQ